MNTQLHGYIDTHSTRNQHIQTQSILVYFSMVIWIMFSNLKGSGFYNQYFTGRNIRLLLSWHLQFT